MLLFFGRILCTPNVRNPNLICINYPKEGKREEKGGKYNWEEIARTQYGKMGAGNSRGWVRDILRNFWAGMCITVHTLWEEEEKGLRGVFKVPCRLTSNYKKRRREERRNEHCEKCLLMPWDEPKRELLACQAVIIKFFFRSFRYVFVIISVWTHSARRQQ